MFGNKPLIEPMLTYFQLNASGQTSVKFWSKYKIFINENAFENVICEMTTILAMGR